MIVAKEQAEASAANAKRSLEVGKQLDDLMDEHGNRKPKKDDENSDKSDNTQGSDSEDKMFNTNASSNLEKPEEKKKPMMKRHNKVTKAIKKKIDELKRLEDGDFRLAEGPIIYRAVVSFLKHRHGSAYTRCYKLMMLNTDGLVSSTPLKVSALDGKTLLTWGNLRNYNLCLNCLRPLRAGKVPYTHKGHW